MSSSNFDTTSISSAIQKIEVDHRISLRSYYKIAENILKQASIYREEKNLIDLYIMLLRFCSLITETIPFHRDYHGSNGIEKTIFKRKLLSALEELESLKSEVRQKIDEIKKNGNRARNNTSTMSSEASSSNFDREKQAVPSAQRRTNPAGNELSRLSISISHRYPNQSNLHTSLENNNNSPPVNEISSDPSPSAPPVEYLDLIDNRQCESPSASQKQPIGSDEMKAAKAKSPHSPSSLSSSTCECSVCLDAPIEGACVPCGHMVGCIACLNEIKDKGWGCPVCRTKIDLVLRLYAV